MATFHPIHDNRLIAKHRLGAVSFHRVVTAKGVFYTEKRWQRDDTTRDEWALHKAERCSKLPESHLRARVDLYLAWGFVVG